MDLTKDIVTIIKDVGFPIAVTIYLLIRMDFLLREILRELRYANGKEKRGIPP